MTRVKTIIVAVSLTAVWLVAPTAFGDITFYQWTGGAAPPTDWQVDGNWNVTGFPNSGSAGAYIPTASDLSLNIGATSVTAALLNLSGTSANTDINITSSGGTLILENGDHNTFIDPDPGVDSDLANFLDHEGVNHGRVYVFSNGLAGSTNQISAPITLKSVGFLEGVDFFGNTSITLSGDINIIGRGTTAPYDGDQGWLRSYLPEGTKLLVTGDISVTDAGDGTTARMLTLNGYNTTDHAEVPRGTIEISGSISGLGGLNLGIGYSWHPEQGPYDRAPVPQLPFGTIILSGDNTFEGDAVISRGNTVIRSNTAFGAAGDGHVLQGGESGDSNEVGYNLIVDGDRTIAKDMSITQYQTIMGNGSLTWNGIVYQNQARGMINLLPHDLQADTGPTLTLAGPVYAARRQEGPPEPGRIITFDGTGKTVITGGVHNLYDDWEEGGDPPLTTDRYGSLRVRGTGVVVLDSPTNYSDYTGHTWVQGGNLHFHSDGDMPNPALYYDTLNGQVLSAGGAVGVDSGVKDNATFLGMLNNSSNGTYKSPTVDTGLFYTYTATLNPNPLFVIYDDGGLMLGYDESQSIDEYTQNLNFNTAPLSNAANMTLAAHEGGSRYTGAITPNTTIAINKNTYMLGGGSGTLTLPNANQLTSLNGLLVTNGGEVRLDATNDYTGTTQVRGKYLPSLQEDAAFGTADRDYDGQYDDVRQQIYIESKLTVTTLANGGTDSSIGRSASDAPNLVVQGSTLKYVGGATTTNRLFTIGTAGATVDASGSGALVFDSAGELGIDTAETRYGYMSPYIYGDDNNEVVGLMTEFSGLVQFQTHDLIPGMAIRDVKAGQPLWMADPSGPLRVGDVAASHVIHVVDDVDGSWGGVTTESFGSRNMDFGPAPARFLTLTGSNTGNNTLTPVVHDASDKTEVWDVDGVAGGDTIQLGSDGGYGSVGIRKTGVGKWVLAGANTYTGVTSVEEGTLVVTGATGYGDTTVAADATLGGSGTVRGDLIADGIVAPGTSPGTLSVLGDYTQSAGATLAIDIASAISFDVLDVAGTADLAGLISVDVAEGYTPSGTYDILLADTLINSGIALATGGDNDLFTLLVNTGTGIVTLQAGGGVIGDYNDDGMVDAADYTVWRDHLGTSFTLPNRDPANSGNVSEADWTSWKAHFGESAGSGALAGAAVPEPSALCLALLALVGMIRVMKRHG